MAKNGVFSRFRRFEEGTNKNEVNELLEQNEKNRDVHVLAVDDSLVDRKVIERLLKITSCRVTAVDSGKKALQFLGLDEEDKPVGYSFNVLKVDLIITDYFMPGMTGYELMKKIKGSSTFREIPVVIMSSENVLARIDRCLEEGAEDFIVKPVKLSDVKRIKSYMFGKGSSRLQDMNGSLFNIRKLQEPSNVSLSSSRSSSSSQDSASTSPSEPFDLSSTSSPSSLRSFSSLPSSPTSSPESPTRR